MLVKTFGSAVYGVEAITITVEVNWMETNVGFMLVGLPDNAVKESFQRVESTIKSLGYAMPRTRIVINLAPADIKKSGTAFDLSIAIGILSASGKIENPEALEQYIIMGEYGLLKALCLLPYRLVKKNSKDCLFLP
jgi:magnesium chelatase family protein